MTAKSKQWNEFKRDFPDFAKCVDIALHLKRIDRIINTLDAEGLRKLKKEHPKWRQIVRSLHFKAWFNGQSPGVKALGDSTDYRDALAVMDLYYAQRDRRAFMKGFNRYRASRNS